MIAERAINDSYYPFVVNSNAIVTFVTWLRQRAILDTLNGRISIKPANDFYLSWFRMTIAINIIN